MKQIRKDIREYILNDVNFTLARLGISEQVVETCEYDTLDYLFQSAPIRQMPVMFKRLVVDGYMVSVEVKDEKDEFYQMTKDSVFLGNKWFN